MYDGGTRRSPGGDESYDTRRGLGATDAIAGTVNQASGRGTGALKDAALTSAAWD